MSRREARAKLAAAGVTLSAREGSLDFFGADNALQIEYADGSVSFIGLSPSEELDVEIAEVDPFDTPARALFERLRSRWGHPRQRFQKDEHTFRKGIVTLYEADVQYDRGEGRKRAIWGQIGVGDRRYLAATDDLDG